MADRYPTDDFGTGDISEKTKNGNYVWKLQGEDKGKLYTICSGRAKTKDEAFKRIENAAKKYNKVF